MHTKKRICLWSSPRNLSTALMYSWAQRHDTIVVDEPLYGYYLLKTGANHPAKDEIIAAMNCDAASIINEMCVRDYGKEIVFFKHMTHHTLNIDLDFMNGFHNVFFIRDPKQIISSYAEVIENPTIADIGIELQAGIYNYALKKGYKTLVLDSGALLKNPEAVLKNLCAELDISFDENMLHWQAGARPEDGIWAKYWYDNVHKSTGFDNQPNSERPLPKHLISLYETAKPFYEKMFLHSINA